MPNRGGGRYFDNYEERQPEQRNGNRRARFHEVFGSRPRAVRYARRVPQQPYGHRRENGWHGQGGWRQGSSSRHARGDSRGYKEAKVEDWAYDDEDCKDEDAHLLRDVEEDRLGYNPFQRSGREGLGVGIKDAEGLSRSPGEKRDQLEDTGNDLGLRKKRKFVPGGAMPKFERVLEYHADSWCDVCETHVGDANAMSLHYRSKEHLKEVQYKRKHEGIAREDKPQIQHVSLDSAVQRRERVEKGVPEFMRLDTSTLPKGFQSWINRSLEAAKKTAAQTKDQDLPLAVMREIVDTHNIASTRCTLRTTAWNRRALASGDKYRDYNEEPSALPIVPDSQLRTKETGDQPAALQNDLRRNNLVRHTGAQLSTDTSEHNTSEARDISQSLYAAQAARGLNPESRLLPNEQAHSGVPNLTHAAPLRSVDRFTEIEARIGPSTPRRGTSYELLPVRWQTSDAAERLLLFCQVEEREVFLSNVTERFGPMGKKQSPTAEEERTSEALESVVKQYKILRTDYISGDYEYGRLSEGLSRVAEQLSSNRSRTETLRACLKIQVRAALQVGHFKDCIVPCSQLVDSYAGETVSPGAAIEMVGHWLIALLFERSSRGKAQTCSALLHIAQEMRKIPRGALNDIWVHEAAEAVKTVLSNNWYAFFNKSLASFAHARESSTSKQILEGLVPFVRERAIVTLFGQGERCRSPTMSAKEGAPVMLPIDVLMKWLGWATENAHESRSEAIEDAATWFKSRPQKFVLGSENGVVSFIRGPATMAQSLQVEQVTDVRSEMLLAWTKNGSSLLEVS